MRGYSLKALVNYVKQVDGIYIPDFTPYTLILVKTHYSLYEIVVVDPRKGDVVIQGGGKLLIPTQAVLQGSTFGGSALKGMTISIGMRLEVTIQGRRFVTSFVEQIATMNNVHKVNEMVLRAYDPCLYDRRN